LSKRQIIYHRSKPRDMPRGPKYTEEELLDEIRRLADDLDRQPPLKKDMNKYGEHASGTYQHRFGSWSAAVQEAGFEPRAKGQNYGERPDACPLCGTEQTGLDFHHWQYGEDEQGCYLCRDCHDDIHDGAKTEDPNWLVNAVENLVILHMEYHTTDPDAEQIVDRYNLTDITDLVELSINQRTK